VPKRLAGAIGWLLRSPGTVAVGPQIDRLAWIQKFRISGASGGSLALSNRSRRYDGSVREAPSTLYSTDSLSAGECERWPACLGHSIAKRAESGARNEASMSRWRKWLLLLSNKRLHIHSQTHLTGLRRVAVHPKGRVVTPAVPSGPREVPFFRL
jgi:hypothetical protein